jgi:hypothetical protein
MVCAAVLSEEHWLLNMKYFLTVAVLLLSINAAQAFRCGDRLISRGDSVIKVLENCGEPDLVEHLAECLPIQIFDWRLGEYRSDCRMIYYEAWTYNLGPNLFMRRLHIQDGEVKMIKTLDYGY